MGWDKNAHGWDKTGHGWDKTGPGSGVEGTTKFIMTELVVPINTIRRASQTQSDGPNTIKNAATDGIRPASGWDKIGHLRDKGAQLVDRNSQSTQECKFHL